VTTTAPAQAAEKTVEAAVAIASRIVDALDYVGSLTAELFDTDQGLLVNELAPRPHNSGHWTMRGTPVCQFENHVRAVLGLPVATPRVLEPVAMINVLGRLPDLSQLLTDDVQVHLYQKSERPGRKLGHLLITGDPSALSELAQQWLLRIESQNRS
jgi:5-(carboxyamino)imidazole ribonucleotide synthase